MLIKNLYRVEYQCESGHRSVAHVWAKSSVLARKKVEGRDGVDYVAGVSRANGVVYAVIAALVVVAILSLSRVRVAV